MPGHLVVGRGRDVGTHDTCWLLDAARHRAAEAVWTCEEPVQYAAWKAEDRPGSAHATMRPSTRMRASKVASSGCLL